MLDQSCHQTIRMKGSRFDLFVMRLMIILHWFWVTKEEKLTDKDMEFD